MSGRPMPALTRKFETADWATATHYHHAREGEVFPIACYAVMHQHDCVLPLRRVFDPPPPAPRYRDDSDSDDLRVEDTHADEIADALAGHP